MFFFLGTVSKLSLNTSDHCPVNCRSPFCVPARNGHRRVPSAGCHYGRYVGLTNHARDDVLINQCEGKISDNLETVPYVFPNAKMLCLM